MPVYWYGEGSPKERFQFWLDNTPSAIDIDVETVSLKDRTPLGFSIAFSPYEAVYFDISHEVPREIELLKPMLSNMNTLKIGHNLMFDLGVFPLVPVIGECINTANIFDTNIAARILGYENTDLPTLSGIVSGGMALTTSMATIMKENGCKDNLQLIAKNPQLLADHCAKDSKASYRMFLEFLPKIEEKYKEYFSIEMRALPIVLKMSLHGLKIDQRKRWELAEQYQKEIDFYSDHIKSFGVEKPTSSKQIGYTLAERGNFLRFTPSKKQYCTKESELEFISDPLAASVLGFREKFKFKTTYLDPLENEDRFYTEYYFDTSVGRLNSRNRNIQNIPIFARPMITPDSGVFTTGDYSREHLYLLANFSEDRDMLRVLYDPDKKKSDLHQHTADKMGVPRSLAKTLNFAVAYGATAETVRDQAKIRDLNRCQRLIDDWFRAYRGVADWVRYAKEKGMRDGWSLPTRFGRRIRIPQEFRKNGSLNKESMERKCVNYPILGSDGEVIKRAFILCDNRGFGPESTKAKMVITVHDSITWDGAIADQLPIAELEAIPGFRVPFEVKQTARWE